MKHLDLVSSIRTFQAKTYQVAAIAKFTDEAECMEFLNQARVGLAGYFFSRDVQQIWRVAEGKFKKIHKI